MKTTLQTVLKRFLPAELSPYLQGIRRGIERESLRVSGDSELARTNHPESLGSALTHSLVTTDYAEAMLEFVTPVSNNGEQVQSILADIHTNVYRHLGDEVLWPLSMPCRIPHEDQIRLAEYGSSNLGRYKSVYRQGLKNRYGSMMQVIAGVHYNFSMPEHFWPMWQKVLGDQGPLKDFISASYMGLIRNFMRYGWLLSYLFGASPAVDCSFLTNSGNSLPLEKQGDRTLVGKDATSLRMSSLGYNNKAQDALFISYNSLNDFICGVKAATNQANVAFAKIGVKEGETYRQLNINTLQNEGELYAPIRPKCVAKGDASLLDGLEQQGIEYVEIRSLDIDPYCATGISLEQIYFMDVFLTYCLLTDSPSFDKQQQNQGIDNMKKVASAGRSAGLELVNGEVSVSMLAWAEEIFAAMADVAHLLDDGTQGKSFMSALTLQHKKLRNPDLTPSARLVSDMEKQSLNMTELAMNLALDHRQELCERTCKSMQEDKFDHASVLSWQKQRDLEETDSLSFDDFLNSRSELFSSASMSHRCTNRYCRLPNSLDHCVGIS